MPKKVMRCVEKLKKQNAKRRRQGKSTVNPYAVCVASTGQKLARHKKKKKNRGEE